MDEIFEMAFGDEELYDMSVSTGVNVLSQTSEEVMNENNFDAENHSNSCNSCSVWVTDNSTEVSKWLPEFTLKPGPKV